MGDLFPTTDQAAGGDEPTYPLKNSYDHSLLGAERGTQQARRLETDADNNLYVRVAADDTVPGGSGGISPLAGGSVTSVPAATLTTIVTYTAPIAKQVTKISCGGTVYGKFQLFKNTVLFDTHRSAPDRTIQLVFEPGLALAAGDALDVKVTHFQTGLMEYFEATIYGA